MAGRLPDEPSDRPEDASSNRGRTDDDDDDDDFVNGYENPVAWAKRYETRRSDRMYPDVLLHTVDTRDTTLGQFGGDKPEYVKWKLFGYNLVICYEYISKGETDKALKAIGDIEHDVLSSIGNNDPFLKSIQTALNHVTLSTKSHLLKLCAFGTEFVMPNKMNQVNKAGLYGIQTLFFYYGALPYVQIAKDCALKAISLNEHEAEWHYLLSAVLTHWHISSCNLYECSKLEIDAAEKAVKLGINDVHKLHLVHIYQRMSRNSCVVTHAEMKNRILDTGLQLLNDVMKNSTNDFLLLKNCLQSLTKFSLYKPNDSSINEIIENLINKLKTSNNGFIHGAIGNYYLFNKKDFEMANFHLKKAFEAKSFGYSIDYIQTLYRMNPDTTQIEPLLVDMLKSFLYPVHQEKILSLIVSYLLLTKNDLIQTLKYVPKLLSLKNVTCIYNLLEHRAVFSSWSYKRFNLIDTLLEKFNVALKDSEFPADYAKKITEVLQMIESYKQFASCFMMKKENYFKRDVSTKNNNNMDSKELWRSKNPRQNTTIVKSKDEENWRSLKPDSIINQNIFSRGIYKQTSNSSVKIKSRSNDQS